LPSQPNQINLDDTSNNQISLDTAQPTALTKLSSDAVEDRSSIASLGLSNTTGIPQQEFRDAIGTGNEASIRQRAADVVNQTKINWAKKMIDQYGSNLPDDTLQTMLKAQDPNSVFEEHYAKSYMDYLNWPKDKEQRDNWAWTTANMYPEQWDYLKQQGEELLAKYQYIHDKYQDAYGHTSWQNALKNNIWDLGTLGFHGEAQMRENGFFNGLGLGANLQQQKQDLFAMPFNEGFKKRVDDTVASMEAEYAPRWLQAMVGQTTKESNINDFMTAANVLGVVQIGAPLGKAAISKAFVEANARVAARRMTTAVSDMVATRPITIPPAVSGPAVAGNTVESAIQKVKIDGINQIYGTNNPVQTLVDRMSGNYDVLDRQATGNPGAFGREVANRVSDMINANKDRFISTIMDEVVRRGDRTPAAELEDRIRQIHAGIADLFPGADNRILDIGKGIRLPGLNVRMYNTAMGTPSGELFNDIEQAKADARSLGYIIKGDYAVKPEERPNIARKEALIRSLRTAAQNAQTFEGATTALNRATKLQRELDKLPKHDTGITIEPQPYFRYSGPIGPSRMPVEAPRKPTGALKSTEGTQVAPQPKATPEPPVALTPSEKSKLESFRDSVKQELDAAKKDLAQEDNPKRKANHERRIARLEKDITDTNTKLNPSVNEPFMRDFVDDLEERLGRKATIQEIDDEWRRVRPEDFKPTREGSKQAPPRIDNKFTSIERFHWAGTEEEWQAYKEWRQLTTEQRAKEFKDKVQPKPNFIQPSDTSAIVQQGNGYYMLHTVFLPEEKDFVRDGLITSRIGGLPVSELRSKLGLTVDTGIPNDGWARGWANAVWKGWRSPAERLSTAENINRLIATHGPSILLNLLEKGSTPIAQMPKKYWGDFNRLIKYLQQTADEGTGIPGMWFDTPFDVHAWYMQNLKRAPDETELKAYFAYRTLMIDDLNMRNMGVMQRKLVMGAKQYTVSYMDESGNKVTTPAFEAVELNKIPDHGRLLTIDHNSPMASKWNLVWRFNNNGLREIENDVLEGRAKILHVFNPKDVPLKDLNDHPADYIVSYSNEQKPLGFEHVNAQGGGHMIPRWGWFLKQADVNNYDFGDNRAYRIYNGDKTLFSFKTRSQAEAAIPHLENVRKLLKQHVDSLGDLRDIQRWENEGGAISEGVNYYQQAADQAKYTGVPFDKLVKWWVGPRAAYDVNQPIKAVSIGNKIIDMDNSMRMMPTGGQFVDATKDGSLLGRAMLGFTQERDMEGLYTLRRTGTESNPAYVYEDAPLIDPITAMERGYNGVAKSLFMWDMKKFSIEHWLEQAKGFLEEPETIRTNPLSHFYNPKYLRGTLGSADQINLETNRRMAMDFVGMGDKSTSTFQKMAQDFSDHLFNRNPKNQVAALYDLPNETSYTRWIRNLAFYASQISLKTYFTQASTLSNIYFIAGPQNASKATAAMTMYGWWNMASRRPEILAGLDNSMARYFGWQPGKFTEAIRLMEGAGFHAMDNTQVAREGISSAGLQWVENATPISIGWRTAAQYGRTILDYASLPFNIGTATTRRAAFFTAYLEQLDKAPGGVMDTVMRDAMLPRASLLDANMSTAMNTKLNKGPLSIPFQFGTFDKNMTELMWGKQLTPREKIALFAGSGVAFGLRGGFYAALGLPVANYVLGKTETALGYVPGENPLADIAVNGFPSWMVAMFSGFADSEGKKTWVDFSRWGSKGIQSLENFIDQDSSMLKIATGAAGSILADAWQNTYGLRKSFVDMFDKDGYQITSSDVWQAFKTLSVVSDIDKAWLAFQTGKSFTKHGAYVTDIGPVMTMIQAITGLSPTESSDVWIKQKQLSANDESIKATQRIIAQEVMRSYLAEDQGNRSESERHLHNAGVLRDAYIPPEKWTQTMQEAFRDVGISLRDRVDQKLYKDNLDMLSRTRSQQ
jgi:hypothetical protein